jgi:exodeoxyribonuclease VII large subunit
MQQRLQWSRSSLARLSHNLDTVSPLNTLARGYSITYNDQQQVIRTSRQLQPGDTMVSRLADGRVRSTVDTVEPEPTEDASTAPQSPGKNAD